MTAVAESTGAAAAVEAPFGTEVLAVRGCESLSAATVPRSSSAASSPTACRAA